MKKKTPSLSKIASNAKQKLVADLGEASEISHPGKKGESAEKVWIKLFCHYLPKRFKVASAIIIDCNEQTSDQIDCVIFDEILTPQIIPTDISLYVPAEAVHAIFEVKQKIDPRNLKEAAKKVESVRKLHRTTTEYKGGGQLRKPKELFPILGGILGTSTSWKEGFGSKKFPVALKAAQQIEHLDYIFAAEKGFVDMTKSEDLDQKRDADQHSDPMHIEESDSAIIFGVFKLIEELTRQGTVPAALWSEYYSKFK